MTAALLALARVAPLAWLATLPGGNSKVARTLVALLLAALMLPAVATGLAAAPAERPLFLIAIHEAVVGLALGLVSAVPLRAAEAAGAWIDGARRPEADDGERGGAGGMERAYGWLALALFAAVDGPRLWLAALTESYAILPVGHAPVGAGAELAIGAGARLIGLAVTLAAPALLAALAADLIVGLAARSAPALRVEVGRTVRELAVLAAIALTAASAATVLRGGLRGIERELLAAARVLAG